MEQVELQLAEFTLRSRSVAVSHVSAGLRRGLERGETVVVRDPAAGRWYTAVVADLDFELRDTVYRLEIGARLAPEEAAEWLAPRPSGAGEVSTSDLLGLLDELRRSKQTLRALVDDAAR